MGLRQSITRVFSRPKESTNDLSKSQQQLLSVLASRPDLAPHEMVQRLSPLPTLNLAYQLEAEVSFFADVVKTLGQEIFRGGIYWDPLFVVRCRTCGAKHRENVTKCPVCGSDDLRKPDQAQLFLALREDGKEFLEMANNNGQTLTEVGKLCEYHLEVADNGYLICIFRYVIGDDKKVIGRIPQEFLGMDARSIKKLVDDTGAWMEDKWACPVHRDKHHHKDQEVCPECGLELKQVGYMTTLSRTPRYYFTDEVCHSAKYHTQLVYGFPAIFKLLDDAQAYHHLEKRNLEYWRKGRAQGMLTVPTNNPDAFEEAWAKQDIALDKDPYGIRWMSYDPEAKQAIQYLKIMDDPSPAMLEVKKDLRERMGSYFGVSPIFMADTSTSGGLNNEGLQISITRRAVEYGQSIWNTKYLPWVAECMGITDWVPRLHDSEEQDEMAELQRFQLSLQNAQAMVQLGYEAEYHEQDDRRWFTFKRGKAPQGGQAGMPGGMGMSDQQAPIGPPQEGAQDVQSLERFKADNPDLPIGPDGLVDFDKLNQAVE